MPSKVIYEIYKKWAGKSSMTNIYILKRRRHLKQYNLKIKKEETSQINGSS
jgi:hypothetical protein